MDSIDINNDGGVSSRPLLEDDDFLTPSNFESPKITLTAGINDNEGQKKSKPIPTLFFILLPIVILLPTIFLVAEFLPPPPLSRQSVPHADPIAATLLSVSNVQGFVDVLKNDLYEQLKLAKFNLNAEDIDLFASSHGVQSRKLLGEYGLNSVNRDHAKFGESLTLEWYSSSLDQLSRNDSTRQNIDQAGINDDDIVALYCPADETNPKKFRDAATIAQARATHSRHRSNKPDLVDNFSFGSSDNVWTLPSFPIIREDSCEFRLYVHEKSSLGQGELGKSKLWWFSPKKTRSSDEHHYTHVASTGPIALTQNNKTPTGVHISLTGNPSEMNIQFTTGDSGKPVVEIAKKSSVDEGVTWTKVEGVSTTYDATDMCQEPATSTDPGRFISPGQLHTVKVTKLEPGTDYVYRVGVAAGQGIAWSEDFVFRGSPAPGPSASGKPLTFLAFGDQGCEDWNNITSGGPAVTKLVNSLIDNENETISSIHHLGDLSYAMGAAHIWDEWMNMIQPYSSRVPLMVGVGNHEYDHTDGGGGGKDPSGVNTAFGFEPSWGNFGEDSSGECGVPVSKRFAAPANGNGVFWYSFEQSLVHTIMLSSEHNLTAGSKQYIWLEKDLTSINRTITPWVVVEMHRSLYNSEEYWNQDTVGIGMRDEIETLLHAHNVDLSLAGHYHSYLRTCDGLYEGKCDNGGPMYITVGTGGANLDDGVLIPNDWTEFFDESHHGVGKATVVNATALHWEFIAVGGNVTDDIWLTRDRGSA